MAKIENVLSGFKLFNKKGYFSESEAVTNLAINAAQIMLEEVTDWQVLYRAHRVEVT